MVALLPAGAEVSAQKYPNASALGSKEPVPSSVATSPTKTGLVASAKATGAAFVAVTRRITGVANKAPSAAVNWIRYSPVKSGVNATISPTNVGDCGLVSSTAAALPCGFKIKDQVNVNASPLASKAKSLPLRSSMSPAGTRIAVVADSSGRKFPVPTKTVSGKEVCP